MNNQEQIKQYVVNGGVIFYIKLIDTIRDGGTKVINCNNGNTFYIDKYDKKFHTAYPTSEDNLVTDPFLNTYLLDRIESYVKKLKEEFKRNELLFFELNNYEESFSIVNTFSSDDWENNVLPLIQDLRAIGKTEDEILNEVHYRAFATGWNIENKRIFF